MLAFNTIWLANVDFTDLPRRTASDKLLCDKAFNIANVELHQWIISF